MQRDLWMVITDFEQTTYLYIDAFYMLSLQINIIGLRL